MKYRIVVIILLVLTGIPGLSQDVSQDNVLQGYYFGQSPPGDSAVIFAPGIISVDSTVEHGAPTFSPDGNTVFWQSNLRHTEKETEIFLKMMCRTEGKWTAPGISPFGGMPAFSPDGNKLFFLPFDTEKEKGLYMIEKQGDNWSEPKSLNLIARFPELKYLYGPSVTNNGTLYFFAHAEGLGSMNNYGIYRSEFVNGEYAKPELLPPGINAGDGVLNWTPFIAPDESYLLFSSSRFTADTDFGDIYVCFRRPDGSWTEAINLGTTINSGRQERFPSLSPDGKYLFFTRWITPGNEDVMWVSTGILKDLKKKAIKESKQQKLGDLAGDYLGQIPPGLIPEVFAPGIVSDSSWAEHCQLAVSPNGKEIYWSAWSSKYPPADTSMKNSEQIYFSEFKDGVWTLPAIAEFIKDHLTCLNGGPAFSPDGNRLYFYSTGIEGGLGKKDVWYVERIKGGWSKPYNAGEPLNTGDGDWTPSFTKNGNAYHMGNYYYNENEKPLKFKYSNGIFSDPEPVNIHPDFTPVYALYVSPDENYMIFSGLHKDGYGGLDLYMCFKTGDNEWGIPVNMGDKINTDKTERFPIVSPDGKYLFFMRHTPGQDIFWVSTKIFDHIGK